jgi:uncharacterized protein (UPF0332 family)
MNPQDFIKTAEYLQKDNTEASVRSVVSRAYYGMILHVKSEIEYLLKKNFGKGENVHELIPRYLKNSSLEKATVLAEDIQDFRDIRNDADYNMDKKFTEMHKAQIVRARAIIEQFDQLDKRKLQAGIRMYLRTIHAP